MKRYRILFLDVDGVLNSHMWYGKYYFRHRYKGTRLQKAINPACIKRLNYIVDKTDARVVLSSTWRLGKDLDSLRRMFNQVNGNFLLVGITPRYIHKEVAIPRGVEIKEYYSKVYDHPSFYKKCPSKMRGYLILDDDGDMLYEQRDHFLKINNYYGLIDDDVPKAIDILMKELPEVNSYYGKETT